MPVNVSKPLFPTDNNKPVCSINSSKPIRPANSSYSILFFMLLFFRVAVKTSVLDRNIHYLNIIMTIHMAYLIVTKFYKKVIYYFHRLFYINCRNTGSYLGSECNFGFMQIPYFGRQVTIWAWSAQPSLISELPLQLRSRRSRSAV